MGFREGFIAGIALLTREFIALELAVLRDLETAPRAGCPTKSKSIITGSFQESGYKRGLCPRAVSEFVSPVYQDSRWAELFATFGLAPTVALVQPALCGCWVRPLLF